MTRDNKQITQTSQEDIDSGEDNELNDEFSIHTKVTNEQAKKQKDTQDKKIAQIARQNQARESTGKQPVDSETVPTGDSTAKASKTGNVPTTIPPTSHPQVNSTRTANSSTKPALLHEQVRHPQASVWISGPPKAALSMISSSDTHLPRNVQGDAACPPVLPPSSVPDMAENHREPEVAAIRFQGHLSAATSGALTCVDTAFTKHMNWFMNMILDMISTFK
jgi:hypothetical protein